LPQSEKKKRGICISRVWTLDIGGLDLDHDRVIVTAVKLNLSNKLIIVCRFQLRKKIALKFSFPCLDWWYTMELAGMKWNIIYILLFAHFMERLYKYSIIYTQMEGEEWNHTSYHYMSLHSISFHRSKQRQGNERMTSDLSASYPKYLQ
jgi:hypothetical protein